MIVMADYQMPKQAVIDVMVVSLGPPGCDPRFTDILLAMGFQ